MIEVNQRYLVHKGQQNNISHPPQPLGLTFAVICIIFFSSYFFRISRYHIHLRLM